MIKLDDLPMQEKTPRRNRVGQVLTRNSLAKAANVPPEFVQEAQQHGLVQPDQSRFQRSKRYRPKLIGWLKKLHRLRLSGYTWDDICSWTKRRFLPGNEHELQWPRTDTSIDVGISGVE
jgi:hypothetical protein